MAQVVEILPHGRQGLVYPSQSMLMIWQHQEPGHQQQWYWPNIPKSAAEGLMPDVGIEDTSFSHIAPSQ